MPSKGLIFKGQRYAKIDTSDYDDNYNGKMPVFKQMGLRPTSALRRNNPHPSTDFLLPKNLVEMDDQQKFQANIQNAVRSYLGKLYQTGHTTNHQLEEIIRRTLGEGSKAPSQLPEVSTPTMGESEMMENYVNPTEDALERIMANEKQQLKREQGNSDKKAGKVYHKIADDKEQLALFRSSQDHYNPLYQRISRTPQLSREKVKGHFLQWPNAHPPTPGKKGLHENLAASYEVKYSQPKSSLRKSFPTAATNASGSVKRLHTPPTPPDRSRRVKSAAYEAQAESMRRSKSLPPTPRAKSASPPLLEKEADDAGWDMNSADGKERPKTAGPKLANSMVAHPRMKAWIESATSYEKEVARSMLSTLSGRKPTDEEFQKLEATLNCNPAKGSRKTWATSINKPTIPPATHTFDAYIPPSPAPVVPVPNRNGKGDKTTKDWMKKVENAINDRMTPQELDRSTIQALPRGRPLARHQPRPQILQDYRHDNSFFTLTNKGATAQFTIAPDWVSERMKPRRRLKKPSNEQLRYGSR